MTTDIGVKTSTALHAALVAAAGPQRTLTLMALRGLLVGADKTVLVEALSQIVREGVTLPPTVAAAFGLQATPQPPSQPERPTPTRTRDEPSGRTGLPAVPNQKVPGPHFTIELGPDSRLDLTTLTLHTLLPDPLPAGWQARAVQTLAPPSAEPKPKPTPAGPAEPTPAVHTASARTDCVAADAAFDDSSARQPVFNSLKYYRKSIGKYPLLSRQQEAALAQAIEAGLLAREKLEASDRKIAPRMRRDLQQVARLGEQAFTEFAQANLRLVMSVATRYAGRGLGLLDLVQEGNIGMLHAIEMFDHRKGFKFSTYAVQWIRQAIRRALADHSRTIRLPVHAHETLAVLHKAARELGYDAPAEALPAVAAHAGVALDKAEDLLSQVRRTIPLEELAEAIGDDAVHEEADRTLRGPHWSEPANYYRNLSPDEVHTLLDRLPMREHRVLALRHGLEGSPALTLEAIGQVLGVTGEAVRQIESKAEVKLRDAIMEYQNPPIVAQPALATTSRAASPCPAAGPLDVPSVRRKVHASGHIMVARQTIKVGAAFSGEHVTVLLEDDCFRVLHEGRQIATVRRRHHTGIGKIYGTSD
ncbi:sigma-70 family RNA polymerase sigma factor [Streptomyces sp. NPDC050743]|uniref:sigma-70 family RNA polymerase sigma factor n=1 Tax=Streptomyces sp. NPDC050743 TaxID=3365634 RepID=UPI0037B7B1A1